MPSGLIATFDKLAASQHRNRTGQLAHEVERAIKASAPSVRRKNANRKTGEAPARTANRVSKSPRTSSVGRGC